MTDKSRNVITGLVAIVAMLVGVAYLANVTAGALAALGVPLDRLQLAAMAVTVLLFVFLIAVTWHLGRKSVG